MAVDVLAVSHPLVLYIVSKSVFCILRTSFQNVSHSLHIASYTRSPCFSRWGEVEIGGAETTLAGPGGVSFTGDAEVPGQRSPAFGPRFTLAGPGFTSAPRDQCARSKRLQLNPRRSKVVGNGVEQHFKGWGLLFFWKLFFFSTKKTNFSF